MCHEGTLKLYADDVLLGSHDSSSSDYGEFTVASDTTVIGIECESTSANAAILAEIGDDYFSDATWKCFSGFRTGWATVDFDDSTWLYAENVGDNSASSSVGQRSVINIT